MKKPGWKTTEFWMALAAMLFGAYEMSGALEATATIWDDKIIGMIISGLALLGYTGARAFTKVGEARAEAIALIPTKAP